MHFKSHSSSSESSSRFLLAPGLRLVILCSATRRRVVLLTVWLNRIFACLVWRSSVVTVFLSNSLIAMIFSSRSQYDYLSTLIDSEGIGNRARAKTVSCSFKIKSFLILPESELSKFKNRWSHNDWSQAEDMTLNTHITPHETITWQSKVCYTDGIDRPRSKTMFCL